MARVSVGYFMQANKALFHADKGNVPIAIFVIGITVLSSVDSCFRSSGYGYNSEKASLWEGVN